MEGNKKTNKPTKFFSNELVMYLTHLELNCHLELIEYDSLNMTSLSV